MKKLKLDLDTLAVESYATQATDAPSGTVAAQSNTIVVATVVTKTPAWTIAATEQMTLVVC